MADRTLTVTPHRQTQRYLPLVGILAATVVAVLTLAPTNANADSVDKVLGTGQGYGTCAANKPSKPGDTVDCTSGSSHHYHWTRWGTGHNNQTKDNTCYYVYTCNDTVSPFSGYGTYLGHGNQTRSTYSWTWKKGSHSNCSGFPDNHPSQEGGCPTETTTDTTETTTDTTQTLCADGTSPPCNTTPIVTPTLCADGTPPPCNTTPQRVCAQVPGKVTDLVSGGLLVNGKVDVSWRAPANDGGADCSISGYESRLASQLHGTNQTLVTHGTAPADRLRKVDPPTPRVGTGLSATHTVAVTKPTQTANLTERHI